VPSTTCASAGIVTPAAYITGRALDADTGQPIGLDQILLCQFERRTDGQIVRRG
jgi:hypothetical protein